MNNFTDLNLLPAIQKSLDRLGFTQPTEIQAQVIPLLLADLKQDIHAQAQTGTGKTLAFGIPLLHAIDPTQKNVQALIVAPTRELVMQIYESIKEIAHQTGIVLEPIYGGMPIERQIANIRRGTHIIVGTPGRLNDHLRRKTLSLDNLKILVLDEADIMLDMGFKEEVDDILMRAPKNRQIWLFSATVMSGIRQLIKSHMHDVAVIRAATDKGVICSQVKQYYCIVPSRKRVEVTGRFIEANPDFYGIIFCQTKILTSEVMEQLASRGFKVNCLHGDMKQALRNKVIRGFKNKDFNILVATNVAARGLDISDLTHIINFSIPEEHESYIHRVGRTGRAGKEGVAIVFVTPDQVYRVKRLEKIAQTRLQEIQIPTLAMVINAKVGAVSDFIEQAKKPDRKLSEVHQAVKGLINSFTEDEIRNSLAMALEDKFFKDISHEDLSYTSYAASSEPMNAPQEICLELGLHAGLTEEAARVYVSRTCNLKSHDIRKVRVLDKRTFISVPENCLQACVDAMRASPFTKKAPRISIVEDVRQGGGGRFERRDRGGSRFGFRSSNPMRKRRR